MADWLKTCGIEMVVMQSTGVYWIALYGELETRGFKMCLANARHTKNLPCRKSDVQESQWLLKLHTYGLLRNSFRPPDEIRALRSLWRLRDRHVKEAATPNDGGSGLSNAARTRRAPRLSDQREMLRPGEALVGRVRSGPGKHDSAALVPGFGKYFSKAKRRAASALMSVKAGVGEIVLDIVKRL
jgi:transposase